MVSTDSNTGLHVLLSKGLCLRLAGGCSRVVTYRRWNRSRRLESVLTLTQNNVAPLDGIGLISLMEVH